MIRKINRPLALTITVLLLLLTACSSSQKPDSSNSLEAAPPTDTTLPPPRVTSFTPTPAGALPPTGAETASDPPVAAVQAELAGEPTPPNQPAAESPPAEPAAPTPEPQDHTVQPGESLLGLAQDYQVPMAAIQLASDLGEQTSLMAGQLVRIPSSIGWEHASPYWLLHEVKAGDTLSGIAADHGLKVADIQAANQLGEGQVLAIGQLLLLPFSGPEGIHAQAPPAPPPAPAGQSGGLAGDDTGSASAPAPLPTPLPPPSNIGDWQRQVFQLINEVRAQHGLFPLTYNEQLAWAAQLHAQDCHNRGWCSHTGSDGASTATRIARTGYAATGSAECWVKIDSPYSAVSWWMDEVPPNDPHRRTLLSDFLTEVGVGIVATDWGYYFIADFGRR